MTSSPNDYYIEPNFDGPKMIYQQLYYIQWARAILADIQQRIEMTESSFLNTQMSSILDLDSHLYQHNNELLISTIENRISYLPNCIQVSLNVDLIDKNCVKPLWDWLITIETYFKHLESIIKQPDQLAVLVNRLSNEAITVSDYLVVFGAFLSQAKYDMQQEQIIYDSVKNLLDKVDSQS